MRDVSALQTLYSALIQANSTILAILAGFLLAFPRSLRSHSDTTTTGSEEHQGPHLVARHFSVAFTVVLFIGIFGIFMPAVLLALLPSDPNPTLRSYFAVAAYGTSLVGITLLLLELDPESTDPDNPPPNFARAYKAWLIIIAAFSFGILVASFIPWPVEPITHSLPTPTAPNLTPPAPGSAEVPVT
jgi:hypothetical protein